MLQRSKKPGRAWLYYRFNLSRRDIEDRLAESIYSPTAWN
jgi:hypothetical protein